MDEAHVHHVIKKVPNHVVGENNFNNTVRKSDNVD